MNVQLSDFGSVNLTGRYVTDGFGGLEENVLQRSMDTQKSYSVTTNLELGKLFPDKAKVTAPLYYSYTKEDISPKYNPLDSDMELDDALESAAGKRERDSIESIAVTKHTTRNFSISNARVGIKNKRHPLPIDPANFGLSYSHSHRKTTGETTVWETEDQWRGSLNYSYSPVYKTWEPWKKSKSKSKWMQFPKAFGLNYLPQNITFNSEILRNYYELQERDLENTENPNLPLSFSEQFLWNRDFSLRWDLTKNLHMNFQSATHAEIEEPYTPINKDLYADQYQAWKDSVWQSVRGWGVPLDYRQSFTSSYQLPLDKLPIFDWLKADASYNATYSWLRGTQLDDGTSLGNTIQNNRNLNLNGSLNMEALYNHIPFLKQTNERFKKVAAKKTDNKRLQAQAKQAKKGAEGPNADANKLAGAKAEAKELPKNKNTFQKEVTLQRDSTVIVQHGKKSKRLIVSAKNKDGKSVPVKWKTVDENKIKVWVPRDLFASASGKKSADKGADALAVADSLSTDSLSTDSLSNANQPSPTTQNPSPNTKNEETADALKLKISVTPKEPLENQWWYNPAQQVARFLMMLRTVNLSYRNQYAMALPGFMPRVGDMLGQRSSDGLFAPGLDFAFGMTGDSYIDKAKEHGWLLSNDSVATPSTTSATEDLQIRATLEPLRDLKIDLSATRTVNRAKSIQYMYIGSPTTHSGSFTMTTISIKSALEGMGNANNGYHSKSFDEFCGKINQFRDRVEAQYAGSDRRANPVDPYSADVLVPAFLSTYTVGGSSSLDIFPALSRLLPNWTVRYAGLGKLPWLRERFKSVNINHGYKSVYSVGSYASYSSWLEYMGDLGYVQAADGTYTPSSVYNISTVSINEAFSPLLGVDMTLQNNLTVKVEYKTSRVLNLSMTSVQINESKSKDWVVGLGYKISNFNLFGTGDSHRKVKSGKKGKGAEDEDDSKKGATNTRNNTRGGVNHDLNLRLDFSLRKQAAITRDIASGVSSASSGNTALKISFSADYTLSRFLTLTAYYDRQTNTPLLSSSSYPTTTRDFGLSMKFSLTR